VNRKALPTRPLRQAVYSARAVVSTWPRVFLPIARRKFRAVPDRVVEADTELLVEGFQRSGNTFAVIAFQIAQPRPVKLAHHLHAAAQIVAAVRMGIPALVLIRDPDESVLSHMVREPGITVRQSLYNWVRFYETVMPLRDDVVLADFADVTADFGRVVHQVNSRFGTRFAEFEHTDANVERCFVLIEKRNEEHYGAVTETTVARPSSERDERKHALRRELEDPSSEKLRNRARTVYRTLVPSSTVM
jgi:hypothetical protein